MKLIAKFFAFGVIAASATLAANASPIIGSISGNDDLAVFNNATGTINFGASGTVSSNPVGSTIAPYFSNGMAMTFYQDTLAGSNGNFFYNPIAGGSVGPLPGSTATTGGVEVFSITSPNGVTLAFYTTYDFTQAAFGTAASTPQGVLLTGLGYFTETGYDPTPGTFTLNGSESAGGVFSFGGTATATPVVTPEPNSLILLGTGLVSAAGVGFRKRRTIA
jgi:hypothetical protein